MNFLAADIGGSRSRLLVGDAGGGAWRVLRQETLASADHDGFDDLLARFLRPEDRPEVGCIALAGPVAGAVARMTNLPWRVDADDLARRFGLRHVRLMNDFTAQAQGLPHLDVHGIETLQPGSPPAGAPRALLGAGTGLGVALLVEGGASPLVLASEGGHADFAPGDEEQLALLQHLLPHHGRVSLETVLSGPGLERIYTFVAGQPAGAPPALDAATIGAAGLAGDPMAFGALRLFARIYASAAGNLALTALARGGVYLTGGIAPRILPFLDTEEALAAFRDKPPMAGLLAAVPLHVVTDDLLGLWGAAEGAARLAHTAG